MTRFAPEQRARLGIGYVPQGRDIFSRLSVEENLLLGLECLPKVVDYFYIMDKGTITEEGVPTN